MGWDFYYNMRTKADLVSKLLKGEDWLPGENIAHRLVGNNLWIVRQFGTIEGEMAHFSGKRKILLSLLGYDRQTECWGHKDISETMGPAEHDCPLAFLDLATDFASVQWSSEWREKVRAFHARKKTLEEVEIAPEQRIVLGGAEYTVVRPYRTKGYWIIRRASDGDIFKARVGQIRQSLLAARSAA